MNKEAIEKLEKGIRECEPQDIEYPYGLLRSYVLEALALLRAEEPKCKTCGDTREKMCAYCSGDGRVGIPPNIQCPKCEGKGKEPCPDCKPEEPLQGEFTKDCDNFINHFREFGWVGERDIEKTQWAIRLRKACSIIDRQAAELKQIYDTVEIAVDKELISCAESEHRKALSPEYISALEVVRDKIKEKQDAY